MKKKIAAAILLGIMVIGCAGCKDSDKEEAKTPSQETVADADSTEDDKADNGAENNTDDILITSEEETQPDEIEKEQELGEAQAQADAIEAQHQDREIPETSVDQAAFTQKKLMLDESANWIRISSETREDGTFGEAYAYDERLEYTWNYAAAEKADAQSGLEAAIATKNWELADSSRNDALSEKLGCEVYDYTAYEDDNGYSMFHQGVYVDVEGGYYLADFSMMEGDLGEYYNTAQALLGQIYVED